MNWDDGNERFFNPQPTIRGVPLPGGSEVVVIDDVLLDPAGLVDWACGQAFRPPAGFPYPGLIVGAPPAWQPAARTSSRNTRARACRGAGR